MCTFVLPNRAGHISYLMCLFSENMSDLEALSFMEDNADQLMTSDLDTDLILALGEPSSSNTKYGDDVHPQILARINNILTEGLSKEETDKIIKSQLVPANGKLLEETKRRINWNSFEPHENQGLVVV